WHGRNVGRYQRHLRRQYGHEPAGNTPPVENYRMLGAIVDFGPKFFYFKLTGPRDTVGLWTAILSNLSNT
ncbi:MAG: hypothetical protein VX893_01500, partial [Candidatus Latescibacterota bacterium]|nr:hypothetical protein [Candidatus Latescibacterota bacterium]